MRKLQILTSTILLLLLVNPLFSEFKAAPTSQVSQVIIQACLFEKSIAAQKEISIYVMGDKAVADVLSAYKGQALGSAKLKKLESGEDIPADKPTILFLGNAELTSKASSYCQENSVLSVTNLPKAIKGGISLGIGINGSGSPSLLLNPTQTAKEGKNWNPAIMKMAEIVK